MINPQASPMPALLRRSAGLASSVFSWAFPRVETCSSKGRRMRSAPQPCEKLE